MNIDRLRSTLYAGMLGLALMLAGMAANAQPVEIVFPGTPCDSTVCDTLVINNSDSTAADITLAVFRDGKSYLLDPGFVVPQAIAPFGRLPIAICFRPARRGPISDSLLILKRSSSGLIDSVKVRLVGKGNGPAVDAVPGVLNFPKTNPGFTSNLTMWLRNSGDLPLTLDTTSLVIPDPFVLITPLPITINPADSVQIEISFQPDSSGIYSRRIDLATGCNTTLQLRFNGVTDFVGTGAVLRISKTGFNPVNNEQIPCDSSRCTDLTLSNIGNAPLIIENIAWVLGNLGYTITNPIPTPFVIPPQGSRDVRICIVSNTRGTLIDTLEVTSNTRSSIAFGLVIDVSGSMRNMMDCGGSPSPRMTQAIQQAQNFIGRTLLYLPAVGIQDQLAIATYTTDVFGRRTIINDIFPLTFITDPTRTTAQNSVAGLTPQSGTPTGEAVDHMIDIISRSPLASKVIVLLTDGVATDMGAYPIAQVAAKARARGIRVFTIGIGLDGSNNAQQYLQTLATNTNGAAYDASDNDCSTLQNAFEAITDLLSRGTKTYEPFKISIVSPYLVTLRGVTFDSVYVNGTTCRTITLTNAGEGTALIDSATLANSLDGSPAEFTLGAGLNFPIAIPEAGQISITLCFKPERIRNRAGRITVYYNSCGSNPVIARLDGAAWALSNLRVTDERIGLPGDFVKMPVYVDSVMTEYSVNTITYQVRWNKSMLDLRGVTPSAAGACSAMTISKPVTFGDRYASVEITASGSNIPGNSQIADLEFMVLRGDSLGSTIEVTAGNFEDNNPRTLLANAGMIAFDSVCFRNSKPLRLGGATKIVVGDAVPTPSTASVTLPFTADGLGAVSVAIYGPDGTLAVPATEYMLDKGHNELVIDLAGMASGSYYALINAGDGSAHVRRIVLSR